MQIDYISKREVTVPKRTPQALTSLLEKTQEGLSAGGGLDTVRWLHDSLAYLTEFFASFAVGALQTVGPYSPDIERLLQQPHSLDRSERLLTQAFVDWKAHPHHPAYESLRETFYLTSRLQSSRFAPRRHTRWLGVEGRAVAGLEPLPRWSRRLDLVVSGNDEATAADFINGYTPILWTWTDALSDFFSGWVVDVVTKVDGGSLSLSGSASKNDVRLQLVPVDRIAGLKSLFVSDGNGGVVLQGFAEPGSASVTSQVPEPAVADTPTPNEHSVSAEPISGEDLPPVQVEPQDPPATGSSIDLPEPEESPLFTTDQNEDESLDGLLAGLDVDVPGAGESAGLFTSQDSIDEPPDLSLSPTDLNLSFESAEPEASGVVPETIVESATQPSEEFDLGLGDSKKPETEVSGQEFTADTTASIPAAPATDLQAALEAALQPDGQDATGLEIASTSLEPQSASVEQTDAQVHAAQADVVAPNVTPAVAIGSAASASTELDFGLTDSVDISPEEEFGSSDLEFPSAEPSVELGKSGESSIESGEFAPVVVSQPDSSIESPDDEGFGELDFSSAPEMPDFEMPNLEVPEIDLTPDEPIDVPQAPSAPDFTVEVEAPDYSLPDTQLEIPSPDLTGPSVPDFLQPVQEPVAAQPPEVVAAPVQEPVAAQPPEVVAAPVQEPVAAQPPEVVATPVQEPVAAQPPEVFAAPVQEPVAAQPPEVVATPVQEPVAVQPPEVVATPVQEPVAVQPPEVVPTPVQEPVAVQPPEVVPAPVQEPVAAQPPEVVATPVQEPVAAQPPEVVPTPVQEPTAVESSEPIFASVEDSISDSVLGAATAAVDSSETSLDPESQEPALDFGQDSSAALAGVGPSETIEVQLTSLPQPVHEFSAPEPNTPEQTVEMDITGASPTIPDFEAPVSGSVPQFDTPAAESVPHLDAPAVEGVPQFEAPAAGSVPQFETPAAGSVPQFETPTAGAVPQVEPPATESSEDNSDDMFALQGDMFSSPGDSSAPLFPVDAVETAVSSSPFVAQADPTIQSVELDTAVTGGREMGASAEEILDDGYTFSPSDGPAPPRWKGWNVDQRESVQEVCEFVVGQSGSTAPPAYSAPVFEALGSGIQKIQVLLEPQCGKTRLAQDLARSEASPDKPLVVLASWEKARTDGQPGTELLRFYYELKRGKRAQGGQLILPEPQTLTALAISADRAGFSQAFQRLIGQLATLNKSELLFVLDEPPELVREALGGSVPSGVRYLSLVNPDESLESMGTVVDLRGRWKDAAFELFGEATLQCAAYPNGNLLRLALAAELINADCAVPASLAEVEETVLKTDAVNFDLVAVLSLEERPVSLDDLDQWFLEADSVTDTITSFPSLFELKKTRLCPVLGLSHPSVERLVSENFSVQQATVARKLLGWVVVQLERTNSEKYGGLQVREIVFRNFLRLYRYADLSDDPAILEWVLRNKDLQKLRVALTGHFEKPGSRYELQELLQLSVDLLGGLVDSGQCDDLQDELGWALSNLAHNQLKLGLLPQACDNISLACDLFEKLVNQEKQYEFRPALSTTYFRASCIFEAMLDLESAMKFANSSVQGFVDLVEDRGRTELAPRLGVALAHRGGLLTQGKHYAAAKTDLNRASGLLESLEKADPRESYRTLVDIQLELVSILLSEKDLQGAVRESGKAVQLATVAVEEEGLEDFQPLLATSHAVRGKAYFKLGESDRALRDISKSISLRNLSVDEGRLEQRFHLAQDLQLRAQIQQAKGSNDDAARDLGRAVEVLKALHAEGRSDAAPQLLQCLQDRALVSIAAGDASSGVDDLKVALSLLAAAGDLPDVAEKRLSIQDSLMDAYLQQGDVQSALPVSQQLLTEYHASQSWESFARVQLVRGEAFERLGQLNESLASYNQAVSLLSQMLSQGQTDERLGRVAEAYLGVGGVQFKLGNMAEAIKQVKQSVDVFSHLFQQRQKPGALPRLLKAYSLYAAANLSSDKMPEAKQALKSGFDILAYMEANGGKGGVPRPVGMEIQKGELHRQRARLLLAEGDPNSAYADSEEAIRNFLETRKQGQASTWKDELGRTSILRSKILFALKDFAQADSSIQDAIKHFEERVQEGRIEFFGDLMRAMAVRAENSARSGKIDQVLEEYQKMISITTSVAKSGAAVDHELEMAKIFEKRAKVYRDQNLLNEAYADYENVVNLYRNLVTKGGRAELATELIRVHLARGQMTTDAGHPQHAVNDFTEAVNVAKALVGQGQVSVVGDLANALHRRAETFRAIGRGAEALQDLEGCVGFRLQMVQGGATPELMGSLGKALLTQAALYVQSGQMPQAADSLNKANSIFTDLVEKNGHKEFSSELAQGLIQRVSLSQDKSDPGLREVLIKAVDLVAQQAREGKPVSKEFSIECLRTVVELLQREDFETVGHLIDSVLGLIELVVTDGRSEQDFVKLTDLLLAASAGLIDDRRTARRPHFLSLACVSCNREIQMFGKNSLPRLVYCLYELGQALERSKPPGVLNYVGSSFALLGELAVQQQTNEDFLRELKMMVSTWRSLPPQVPALANVSRHMLSQLLRLT